MHGERPHRVDWEAMVGATSHINIIGSILAALLVWAGLALIGLIDFDRIGIGNIANAKAANTNTTAAHTNTTAANTNTTAAHTNTTAAHTNATAAHCCQHQTYQRQSWQV